MDAVMLGELLRTCHLLVTVEEGTVVNGFGAMLARQMQESHPEVRVLSLGIADELMVQASRAEQLERLGLTPAGIVNRVKALLATEPVR
jgi:1-deoxy-D-xylulose-5-phosphate synthase